MAKCDVCGRTENMPYHCRHCGGTHCAEHRLPENHACPGLESWDDPSGVFDSGFDDSVQGQSGSEGLLARTGLGTGRGSALGYFRGNVSYLFLAIMLVVFVLEHVVLLQFGYGAFETLFVLTSAHPEYLWTWVTSVFSHAPFTFFHIFGNGIVLFFFGPFLEQRIGSKRFAALFLVSGMVAGLAQIASGYVLGTPITSGVLGASGAIMAVLGVITVLNPDLKVYLYFILPIPIWVLTFGYAGLSVVGVLAQGSALNNVAHFAHLSGLVIGLAYGQRVKSQLGRVPNQLQFGGGGGGMGGPGRGRF
jgi:hypothetical protein